MTAQIEIIPPRVRHTVVVREDEATDGGKVYLAEIPEFPGCMSHGETPEEARQGLEEALELYLEALEEAGQPRPVVQPAPATTGTGLIGGVVKVLELEDSLEVFRTRIPR